LGLVVSGQAVLTTAQGQSGLFLSAAIGPLTGKIDPPAYARLPRESGAWRMRRTLGNISALNVW